MRAPVIFMTFVCAASLNMERGGKKEVKECATDYGEVLKAFKTKVSKGGDASNAQEEICQPMKEFFKCSLRASFITHPTEDEIEKLKRDLLKSTQKVNNVYCYIDMAKIADEALKSPGIVHSSSYLAIVLAACVAMFVSKRL